MTGRAPGDGTFAGFLLTSAPVEALRSVFVDADPPRIPSPVPGQPVTAPPSVLPLAVDDPLALASAVATTGASHVLVASTVTQRANARAQATYALAERPDLYVACRAVPASVLAIAHAVGRALAAGQDPGIAVAVFDRVLASTWSAVWLRSVAHLQWPRPSLKQHMWSWVPGGLGFLAVQSPRPGVISARDVDGAFALHDAVGRDLLVAGETARDLAGRIAAVVGAASTRVVAPVADDASEYGARSVEFAAVQRETPTIGTDAIAECKSCGLAIADLACPFCHVQRSGREDAAL